jgi:hypothetical protein
MRNRTSALPLGQQADPEYPLCIRIHLAAGQRLAIALGARGTQASPGRAASERVHVNLGANCKQFSNAHQNVGS